MKQQLILRWQAFSNKEQRGLIALAVLMLCLLVYAYGWRPVQYGRENLAKIIPEKQRKLLLMRSQAVEITQLLEQKNQLTQAKPGALKASVVISAKFHGLAPNYSVESNDSQLSLSLTRVNFNAWVKWVESLQSQHQVQLKSCHIVPASAGLVNVEAVFSAFNKV